MAMKVQVVPPPGVPRVKSDFINCLSDLRRKLIYFNGFSFFMLRAKNKPEIEGNHLLKSREGNLVLLDFFLLS